MNPKRSDDPKQLKLDFRVRLEPVLEEAVIGLPVAEVERRAREHWRWAHQLFLLGRVMRADGVPVVPRPAARVKPCPCPERN
jgi:hypothetical protein